MDSNLHGPGGKARGSILRSTTQELLRPAHVSIHNVSVEDSRRVLDVNLVGVFNCMKAEIIAMRADGKGGAIVNTASVAGFTTWTQSSAYGASKAAVIQLTKLAAAEYAREGIRVNCVSPENFVTRFHDERPPGALEDIRHRHPLGRFGTTDEIAQAFVYFVARRLLGDGLESGHRRWQGDRVSSVVAR